MTPEEILKVLRAVEWAVFSSNMIMQSESCPICYYARVEDHAPDCRLAAAITTVEGWVADPALFAEQAKAYALARSVTDNRQGPDHVLADKYKLAFGVRDRLADSGVAGVE